MSKKVLYFTAASILFTAFPFLMLADYILSRPDRIAAKARVVALMEVRDQIYRYQSEHDGNLPRSLKELVPKYVREDQVLLYEDTPKYTYSPKTRTLSEKKGMVIHGLWSYEHHPVVFVLEEYSPPSSKGGGLVAVPEGPGAPAESSPEVKEHSGVGNAAGKPPEKQGNSKSGKIPVEAVVPEQEKPPAPPPEPVIVLDELLKPKGPELPDPPKGALVFEAEHYSDTNYAWEVHPDEECGGGAYIHCKEGIANGPGQIEKKVGNFYDIETTTDYTFLRYYFHISKPGKYYVYGRMWTTDTHCSNHLDVGIDHGGPGIGGMDNRSPFRWLWTKVYRTPHYFSEGDHFIHIFIHEDGIRVDQYIISPVPITGSKPFKANFRTGEGTKWEKKDGHPVHLSFDLKSMVFDTDSPPDVKLTIRRLRPAEGEATLKVTLFTNPPPGSTPIVGQRKLNLQDLPELAFIPLKFKNFNIAELPRREYLLEAELLNKDGGVLGRTREPLFRPYLWQTFGPGRYLSAGKPGPLDRDRKPDSKDKRRWTPFKTGFWDHFGVMDFGLATNGNSLHALTYKTIYARTRISVPKTGRYLLKLQSDDEMIFWLDGREVARITGQHPVTRAIAKKKLKLTEGEHNVRIRINQIRTRWQAYVRFRTEDDHVADIRGVEIIEPKQEPVKDTGKATNK